MLPSFLEPREKEREGEREGGGSNTVRERSLKKIRDRDKNHY